MDKQQENQCKQQATIDEIRANAVQSGKWHLITGNRKAIYAIARDSYLPMKI